MRLIDAYVSLSEEALLGGPKGVAVLVPETRCGLNCVFCYLKCEQAARDWPARRIAEWVLASGAETIEWCGWPPLMEAREIARLLGGKVTIILKTSGADAARLPVLLDRERPFYDVYLPDMKFGSAWAAGLLSGRGDYPAQSARTLGEMGRRFCALDYAADGRLTCGVLVRHLMLPGFLDDTMEVIRRFSGYAARYGWPLSLVDGYMPPRGIRTAIESLAAVVPARAHAVKRLAGMLPDGDAAEARRYARFMGIHLA
jgi:putative pyruvate formate lyase activating enzyme